MVEKTRRRLRFSDNGHTVVAAEMRRIEKEVHKLARLLAAVRKQSDKIQQLAVAFGNPYGLEIIDSESEESLSHLVN